MDAVEKKFLKGLARAGRRAAFKRAHPRLWAAWFVVRTLPIFARECCRMGWARFKGRVYVAPRDRAPMKGARTNMGYRPDKGRFGAVVRFPKTGTGYIVGPGGNLVNPKRKKRKAEKLKAGKGRA